MDPATTGTFVSCADRWPLIRADSHAMPQRIRIEIESASLPGQSSARLAACASDQRRETPMFLSPPWSTGKRTEGWTPTFLSGVVFSRLAPRLHL